MTLRGAGIKIMVVQPITIRRSLRNGTSGPSGVLLLSLEPCQAHCDIVMRDLSTQNPIFREQMRASNRKGHHW